MVISWITVPRCSNMAVSGPPCPCESGQWMSGEQECGQRRLLGVSLSYRRGPDVPLPARAHLSALRLPLNGTLALDHLLFLHAWVALGSRGKICGPSLASLLPWHFDVSSVIALGLWPLSLEGFDMKSRLGSQVYPTASDPGLKQSACSLWDTITKEREAPSIGASSAMKYTFLPSYKHILGVLIELYPSTKPLIDF